ncbi:MAG: aminopeptidase P N-terminal domain-containing protein [Betaproteobacteria bacterium]|nr:aminopeptidase P N-terminal domain-containing protein [Betaproteobacteria bacterium]
MDNQAFAERRARLLRTMGRGIAVIPTAPERVRNRDSHYPYRHDSYFYYLSGFPEPEAAVVLVAGDTPQALLFCREKDPDKEVWDGFRHGPDAARETFGFDAAWPIGSLDEKLAELLAGQPVLHYSMGHDADWDDRLVAALNRVRANVRNGAHAPAEIRDVRVELDEMRLIKDAREIDDMRRAADISSAAHCRAMRTTASGRFEYEIEAELAHEFRRRGAQAPAYSPIVAGGANACILHYVGNSQPLRDGELLLIDAGCEIDSYAADITRTFPVSGKFSPAQRDVYELVLAAQCAAIAQIAPGNAWDAPHEAAVRVLAQGMLDLKLLSGSLDGAIESGAYRRFYMHRTGHWLGMDVHDAGEYKVDGNWRPLQPGMTLTVEPGCYIRAAVDVPRALWDIGVRIEDNALVTSTGCEILTGAAPRTIGEIESLMAQQG